LEPARSVDFPTPARRPSFSALDCLKFETTFKFSLLDWKTNLRMAMSEGSGTRDD
jgi:dTDP-4-dehydrorhamnose reductase